MCRIDCDGAQIYGYLDGYMGIFPFLIYADMADGR